MRGEQTGKGRHEIHTAVVVHGAGQRFDFGGAGDQAQIVAQPLHQRTSHRDGAFQRPSCGVAKLVGGCREQAVAGLHQLVASVEQHKIARAIGIFGLAGRKTDLPNRRRVLIAQPASGTPSSKPLHIPYTALDEQMRGNIRRGRSNTASIAASQSPVARFINIVREALVMSVMCKPPFGPPVNHHATKLSIVPNSRSPASAAARAPATLSGNQRIFGAEK